MTMIKEQLESVRVWANDKLATGQEPPWAWYQYMKLRETLDAILAGMSATTPLGSPESGVRQGTHLRLVDDSGQQESAPRHQVRSNPTLPM
jgi:hypothetical protein